MTIEERKTYLLKVCFNLLYKQLKTPYTLNLLAEIVNYDETECDGSCLMEDIASILYEENPSTENDEVLENITMFSSSFAQPYNIT